MNNNNNNNLFSDINLNLKNLYLYNSLNDNITNMSIIKSLYLKLKRKNNKNITNNDTKINSNIKKAKIIKIKKFKKGPLGIGLKLNLNKYKNLDSLNINNLKINSLLEQRI